MAEQFSVIWVDRKREPQSPPDPAYPNGIDLDISKGAQACAVALPYPAKRCGVYVIKCYACGTLNICTTAGRPDDPRSIRMPCLRKGGGHDRTQ